MNKISQSKVVSSRIDGVPGVPAEKLSEMPWEVGLVSRRPLIMGVDMTPKYRKSMRKQSLAGGSEAWISQALRWWPWGGGHLWRVNSPYIALMKRA
jgi:hypothetical protein